MRMNCSPMSPVRCRARAGPSEKPPRVFYARRRRPVMDAAEREDVPRLHSRGRREVTVAGESEARPREHDAESLSAAVTTETLFDACPEDPRTLHLLEFEHGRCHLLCRQLGINGRGHHAPPSITARWVTTWRQRMERGDGRTRFNASVARTRGWRPGRVRRSSRAACGGRAHLPDPGGAPRRVPPPGGGVLPLSGSKKAPRKGGSLGPFRELSSRLSWPTLAISA